MVRVHVRPPSFNCRTPVSGACLWQVQGKEAADPLFSGAFGGLPPREKLNSHSERRGPLARGAIDQVVFSSRSEAPPSPGGERREGTTGRPGAEFWRPGCTGARRMPWRRQAMKDAASCEKPRGGACGPGSGDVRMGQPALREEGAGA